MSNILVHHMDSINDDTMFQDISIALDDLERNTIQTAPWPAYSYKPEVSFVIAYTKTSILLKYYVREKHIRGLHSLVNAPVHEDSCLEFFISFDEEDEYYNLELNCIGTCLFGYGKEKDHRKVMSEEQISKIRRQVIIEQAVNGDNNPVYWELVVLIPINVFIYHNITSLQGLKCKVNFYKCGDHLPEPHFLVWNNIVATFPDFHLPEFFW